MDFEIKDELEENIFNEREYCWIFLEFEENIKSQLFIMVVKLEYYDDCLVQVMIQEILEDFELLYMIYKNFLIWKKIIKQCDVQNK